MMHRKAADTKVSFKLEAYFLIFFVLFFVFDLRQLHKLMGWSTLRAKS